MPTVRSRGILPHWEERGAIYFVTFRLADSLPWRVLQEWARERRNIEMREAATHRNITAAERRRLAGLASKRAEAFLDAGSGGCHLSRPSVGQMAEQALLEFHGTRYRIFAWCVMPNHVHVVFQPLGERSLAEIIHSWKSYSAKRANAILNRRGQFWQREYYDRLIRNEGELHRAVRYVVNNPAKAKLKNWPWVGKMP